MHACVRCLHLDPRFGCLDNCWPSSGLVGLDGALHGTARPSRDPEKYSPKAPYYKHTNLCVIHHIPWELDMKRFKREVVRREVLACVGMAC